MLEIVMFNMSSYVEWEKGVVNRNYHILQYLLKNEKVDRIIAVDFLPFTLKRAVRNFLENIIQGPASPNPAKAGGGPRGRIVYRDLTTKCTKVSEKLFVFSTIDSVFSSTRVIKKLKLVLDKVAQLPNYPRPEGASLAPINIVAASTQSTRLVWSYFPMFVEYFDKLDQKLNIFDAVDNWIEHPSYKKCQKKLKLNYQTIAHKSNLIFTVADSLVDFFKNLGREQDVYCVPNAVDFEKFQMPHSAPKDMEKIPHPIIGYVGNIQNRVDIDLSEYLAQKNQDKSFVFIGPTWPVRFKKFRKPAIEIQRLKKYRNVYFLGWKSYQETPDYIREFDVAIIPHKLDEFIKYTHSLKLLEYLACGKPVVSTPPSGVDKFSHLVYIAQDYRDFDEKIQKALSEDSLDLIELRLAAARENSWQSRGETMMAVVKSKINTSAASPAL